MNRLDSNVVATLEDLLRGVLPLALPLWTPTDPFCTPYHHYSARTLEGSRSCGKGTSTEDSFFVSMPVPFVPDINEANISLPKSTARTLFCLIRNYSEILPRVKRTTLPNVMAVFSDPKTTTHQQPPDLVHARPNKR